MLPLQEHEDRESAPRRTHTSYGPARLLIRHGPEESLVLALGCTIVLTFSRGNAGLNRARIWTQRANQDKQTFSDRLSAERLKPFKVYFWSAARRAGRKSQGHRPCDDRSCGHDDHQTLECRTGCSGAVGVRRFSSKRLLSLIQFSQLHSRLRTVRDGTRFTVTSHG